MVNHPFHDTLFEHWDVGMNDNWDNGSVNHAWSGGPLAVFPANMMGLKPTVAGWKEFTVRPDPAIFESCCISFPTVQGTVAVSYDRKAGQMEVTVPQGALAHVSIPGSETLHILKAGTHRVSLTE